LSTDGSTVVVCPSLSVFRYLLQCSGGVQAGLYRPVPDDFYTYRPDGKYPSTEYRPSQHLHTASRVCYVARITNGTSPGSHKPPIDISDNEWSLLFNLDGLLPAARVLCCLQVMVCPILSYTNYIVLHIPPALSIVMATNYLNCVHIPCLVSLFPFPGITSILRLSHLRTLELVTRFTTSQHHAIVVLVSKD
jgi:hypothetical protein